MICAECSHEFKYPENDYKCSTCRRYECGWMDCDHCGNQYNPVYSTKGRFKGLCNECRHLAAKVANPLQPEEQIAICSHCGLSTWSSCCNEELHVASKFAPLE